MRNRVLLIAGFAFCAGLLLAGCGKDNSKKGVDNPANLEQQQPSGKDNSKKGVDNPANLEQRQPSEKDNSKNCVGNLKAMSMAVMIYLNENRNVMPSIAALEKDNMITKEYSCCPDTKQQYEILIPELTRVNDPNFSNGKPIGKIPMIRCPKHGHVAYLDCHVVSKK